jgi:SAM-dependent methyltransferase
MTTRSPDQRAWLDRARTKWTERVEWWDEMSERNSHAPDRLHDLTRTIDRLRLQPGDRIFDAGCGSGQFAVAFAERGYVVTAADLVPDMVERGRQHAAERGVEVTWRVGDLSETIERGERFDAIHARMTLQFVPDLVQALQRFERALEPDGRLYTSVPGACSPIYDATWRRHLPGWNDSITYLPPWDLERVLEHLGWSIVDQWAGGYLEGAQNDGWQYQRDRGDLVALRTHQTTAFTWAIISERQRQPA